MLHLKNSNSLIRSCPGENSEEGLDGQAPSFLYLSCGMSLYFPRTLTLTLHDTITLSLHMYMNVHADCPKSIFL